VAHERAAATHCVWALSACFFLPTFFGRQEKAPLEAEHCQLHFNLKLSPPFPIDCRAMNAMEWQTENGKRKRVNRKRQTCPQLKGNQIALGAQAQSGGVSSGELDAASSPAGNKWPPLVRLWAGNHSAGQQ